MLIARTVGIDLRVDYTQKLSSIFPSTCHPSPNTIPIPGPDSNRVCKSNTTKCKHIQLHFKMATFVGCSNSIFRFDFARVQMPRFLGWRGFGGDFGRLDVWQTFSGNFCLNGLTFLHV